jgi:tRNA-dihydrouridine synthase B
VRLKTLIIGNGDVLDIVDAYQKCAETGADGAMIGRGVFGRPWLFSGSSELDNKGDPEIIGKILKILVEHTKLFEKKFEGIKSFALMKKFFKSYLAGVPNTKELREKLMQAENAKEVEVIISSFLKNGLK